MAQMSPSCKTDAMNVTGRLTTLLLFNCKASNRVRLNPL